MDIKINFKIYNKILNKCFSVTRIDYIDKQIYYLNKDKNEEAIVSFDDSILLLPTGIHDASGREIFQGDVISYQENSFTYKKTAEVIYENGCFFTKQIPVSYTHLDVYKRQSSKSLKLLAPQKNKDDIFKPMSLIKDNISINKYEHSRYKNSSLFVPGGQSTQLIVGATKESDLNILTLSENLYNRFDLKRVYYSAYIPVNSGKNLPELKSPPTLREHRLYQSDWLLRVYGFKSNELLSEENPNLNINFDPKTNWALNNIY